MGALREQIERTQHLHKVRCTFHCPRPVLVEDHNVATQLYRIAQEAITNAVKHSKAKHIRLSLDTEDSFFRLTIEDDGVGLSRARGSSGMGLRILGYRAALISARLTIKPGQKSGTVVQCVFPRTLKA